MKGTMHTLLATPVRVFRVARNLLIDLRFGKALGGIYLTKRWSGNSDYYVLSRIFQQITVQESDVLVDVGCGRGRVINWWLSHFPRNVVVGIEVDKDIARQAQKRLRKYKNVTVISGDAIESIPEDGTIFYLYNPFEAEMVEAFKDRLASLFDPSHGILLLYYNCKHLSVFEDDPRWRVETVDLGGSRSAPFSQLGVVSMV